MTKALWLLEGVSFLILIAACVSCGTRGRSVSASLASASFGSPPNVGPAPQSYADVVDRAAPAVVTIGSARRVHAAKQFPFFD
jgi:hypothetical protein